MNTEGNTSKSNKGSIYREILDKIVYCEWEPGMLISETMLSEAFHVSRTPIREVLFLLSQGGFVDIRSKSGSYVSRIDLKKIQEILFLRYHLEMPIMIELAQKGLPLPETIDSLVDKIASCAAEENWKDCVKFDYLVHETLIRHAGYDNIWAIIDAQLPHYTRYRFFEHNHLEFKGEAPRSIDEHTNMIRYIRSGDVEKLEEVLKSHYDYTMAFRKQYNLNRIALHPDYFVNLV